MGGGTLWQMKACVIPGNAFSRDMNLEKNYGLPRWIPKNTSQVKSSARLGLLAMYRWHMLVIHTNTHAAYRLPFLLSASKFILHRAAGVTV